MYLGFHCLICDSDRCDNGLIFRVVIYILFLGFSVWIDKFTEITNLQVLRRQKLGQVFYVLFDKFAKAEIWSEFCKVLIVCKCCAVIVRLLLCYYFYGNCFAL
jgi:hypothetical protein